jgi:uncharacterized protein YqiB (DUF1249 family)
MAEKHFSGDLHQQIYKKLLVVIPHLESIAEHGKSVVPGYMDLNLDVLRRGKDKTIIALSHYYKQAGDMIPDPDMVLAVYPDRAMAEALTYQDCYRYQEVYSDGGRLVDIRAKRELNKFLNHWLGNLRIQGHFIKAPMTTVTEKVVACV